MYKRFLYFVQKAYADIICRHTSDHAMSNAPKKTRSESFFTTYKDKF